MHAELTRAIVEEAQQACRYVAKFNITNMDAGDYRDGFETACAVCEDAIASHVERHKDRIETQLAQDLALRDAFAHGTGAMIDGKHVPHNEVFPAFRQQTDLWKQYAADFNAMTDAEIEAESAAERSKLDEAESWLEAVASWEAAGKPREQKINADAEVLRPQE